jgi:outer membrane protein assembly factor BamB
MQLPRNMARTAAATAIVLLVASVMLMAMPVQPVDAQLATQQQTINIPAGVTPAFTCNTRAYLSFTPNPIGVGQPLLVNVWIDPVLSIGRQFLSSITGCYKVTLTKPDGTVDVVTMRSTRPDTTSWMSYIVDQVGEWKIKFDFLGTYFPAGRWLEGYMVTNTSGTNFGEVYYKPASTKEFTFTVREEAVYSWPDLGLPTDYWTRPVDWSHREWWPIMGAYPSTGYVAGGLSFATTDWWNEVYPDTNPQWSSSYMFYPLVQGPESAHVVWKQLSGDGGITGGLMGYYGDWQSPSTPSLVYRGRCYGTYTKPGFENATSYFYCYDIRTGELYWEYPAATTTTTGPFGTTTTALAPQYIAYIEPTRLEAIPESNIQEAAWHVEFVGIFSNTLYKWDPWTGAITGRYNITGSPGGTFHNYVNGYVLGVQNLGSSVPVDQRYRLINWTTMGSSNTFASRVISNTSYARSSLPTYIDWNEGIGVTQSNLVPDQIGSWYGQTIIVYNLYTGAMMHNLTTEYPDTAFSGSCTVVDQGKVAITTINGYVKAWDLRTGKVAWQSPEMDEPWGSSGFGVYGIASAYGMIFRMSYAGLYAFDWDTGKIVWVFRPWTRAEFESPYTSTVGGPEVYPGQTNVRIADGKVYIYTGEHSPQWPKIRGQSLYCLNVTTGEEIWKMAISNTVSFGAEPGTGPIADGYLIFPSSIGTTFVFGKGKSATTVTAPDTAVPLGTAVVIKGTVLDQSPAQPGTPCVSKESMGTYMEYLHLQYPIGGIWQNETITGVPVSLDAVDPNGNTVHIADVVTDGYSGNFGYTWTPEIKGQYAVTATFAGDESYGSSFAQTYVSVGPAQEPYPTPIQPEAPADNTPLFNAIIAAAIAIIIAVAIATVLILIKRP